MITTRYRIMLVLVAGLLALTSCNNPTSATDGNGDESIPGSDENVPEEDVPNEDTPGTLEWTWLSGSTTGAESGIYGTKGVADAANVPGARETPVSWSDDSGNLWLFGGKGYDGGGAVGELNDLWRFDGTAWTWVSGSDTEQESGTYGEKGVADAGNVPGARWGGVTWTDAGGNLWLFGGYGYDDIGVLGGLNDLWRFDGSAWTWVSGSDTRNESGVHGTKGVADTANVPGARWSAVSWSDESGNLWLFGGRGRDGEGALGYLNDLWRFDGTAWTWVSGSDAEGEFGTYGTKGVADAANGPGARSSAVSWSDESGNLWLFGGYGHGGGIGRLNDLWRFDGAAWTWVSGSDTSDELGVHGTKGVAGASNVPGARNLAASWSDESGNLWLFGGLGYDGGGALGKLNDLWRFDGAAWTWVSGSDTEQESGTYGTEGVADAATVPGARQGAVSSTDSGGDLWLFGGSGFDGSGADGHLNGLWRFDS